MSLHLLAVADGEAAASWQLLSYGGHSSL